MKSNEDLALLPLHIREISISSEEIVLTEEAAIVAINYLETQDVRILGWEGWLRYPDGSIGHGNAPQGTVSLERLSVRRAAEICRSTIREAAVSWPGES